MSNNSSDNINNVMFSIMGYELFDINEFIAIKKAEFEDIYSLFEDSFPKDPEFAPYLSEIKRRWDVVPRITVTDALKEINAEKRRIMFAKLPPHEIFSEDRGVLIHSYEFEFENTRWDKNNVPRKETITDRYELWAVCLDESTSVEKIVKSGMLQLTSRHSRWSGVELTIIYGVRCWCTSTGREYFIQVPFSLPRWFQYDSISNEKNDHIGGDLGYYLAYKIDQATSREYSYDRRRHIELNNTADPFQTEFGKKLALHAIAWTCRCPVKNVESLVRQGDIFDFKTKGEPEYLDQPYHLTGDEYLKLLKSQT